MYNNGCVNGSSRKVKIVPDSSCEAETALSSKASKETVATRLVLDDAGRTVAGPTPLLGDNQATRDVIVMAGTTSRTRHFERSTMLVKRLFMLHVIAPWLISTKLNVADIFTKPIDKESFFLFRAYLLNLDNAPRESVGARAVTLARRWAKLLWSS